MDMGIGIHGAGCGIGCNLLGIALARLRALTARVLLVTFDEPACLRKNKDMACKQGRDISLEIEEGVTRLTARRDVMRLSDKERWSGDLPKTELNPRSAQPAFPPPKGSRVGHLAAPLAVGTG